MSDLKALQKKIIEDYIQSYNAFDSIGMSKNLDNEVVFENHTNGEIDLITNGLDEFKEQAEKAKAYFSKRKQSIDSWNFEEDKVTIDINYEGELAIDLPNGANAGDILALEGQSEFLFKNGKIISIKDKS